MHSQANRMQASWGSGELATFLRLSVTMEVGHPSSPAALNRASPPHPVAATSACCCDRWTLNNLSRLCVAAIRCHSPSTFSMPRSRKGRRPRACFICPFTGPRSPCAGRKSRIPSCCGACGPCGFWRRRPLAAGRVSAAVAACAGAVAGGNVGIKVSYLRRP